MNSKKWNVITWISLAAIVIEVVLLFVLVLPAKKVGDVFKNLDKGEYSEAADIYDGLSSKKKDKVQDMLDDYATYNCNKYADGDMDFDEIIELLEGVYLDKDCKKIVKPYISKVYGNELLSIYLEGVDLYLADEQNSGDYDDLYDDFSDLYFDVYEDEYVDGLLCDTLNTKYAAYNEGTVDYDTINAYAKVGCYFFSAEPYQTAAEIDNELYYVELYSGYYADAEEYYNNEEYMECYESCEDTIYWYFDYGDNGTGYQEKFETLKTDAYEAGKTYYPNKIQGLIDDGDTSEAKYLLQEVDDFYGDDLDTSALWAQTQAVWVTAYTDFMSDWENTLRNDLANTGVTFSEFDDTTIVPLDDYMPGWVNLYDLDDNGTPEIFLENLSDKLVYMYTCDGSTVKFVGAFFFAEDFCTNTGEMITSMLTPYEGTLGQEHLKFENGQLSVIDYYYYGTAEEYYNVNGADATREEAQAMSDSFEELVGYDGYDSYTSISEDKDYSEFFQSHENDY